MRENLSAQGNLDEWIDASEEALRNAGFEEVELDNVFDRISAYYGRSGYIHINFTIQNDKRVRLEIEASDENTLNLYKRYITEIMTHPSASSQRRNDNTCKNDGYNDYDDDTDDNRGNHSQGRYSGRSKRSKDHGSKSFNMPSLSHFKNKRSLLSRTWFILLMLLLIPPFGIFLMFYFKRFKIFPRLLITLVAILYTLLIWLSFFGIDTGVNQKSIEKWMTSMQSQVTRLIENTKGKSSTNKTEPTPATNDTVPSTNDQTTNNRPSPTPSPADGVIQNIIDKIKPTPTNDE
ncbi:MAG: VanZ family protein [Eubacterium sp.]